VWAATTLLLMTTAQVPPLDTAADAVAAAYADMVRQAPEQRPYLRYLSMHNLTKEERAAAIPVIAGHAQHLSRASDITRPGVLADGMLLRVNLQDYGWTPETWEKLNDPYMLATVEVIKEVPWGYYDSRGVWYQTRVEKKAVKQLAPAPWLSEAPSSPEKVAALVEWTGSRLPVARADWWFNQTAAQQDREAGYYVFLGIKTVGDFEKLIGFDRKQVEGFRIELRESVAVSGVTLQPRAIARWDSLGGAYWKSFDFKLAKDKKNPLRVLGKDIEVEHDASEGFGLMANGFWATYAADGKGTLQAAAPGDIASDHGSKSNDKQVHANISCIRCHADGGLQNIDGWTRNLLNPPVELRTPDYKDAAIKRAQYLRRLEPFLARDRAIYAAAVKDATGMESKAYAAAYAKFWERYEDRPVTAEIAARDVGLDVKTFRRRLLVYLKTYEGDPKYALDIVASVFVHEGPRARGVPIRQYEEALPAIYQAMHATEKVK
jgi:hypothetical protein